ncbi:PilN domain-containing protein [Ferruginivarius sediminum]|uniref:Fimbrial assembly protein n=1 Tax=Ferruginivarius sediminum TaxID=2661937 RepID=A0A369TFA9_9PROT|nr:PilN domain-containing protein [Ferruginivarius sediminum]RDD63065.1 hypothetical protein DRB17_04645 [Ferruginivarius sediminum]
MRLGGTALTSASRSAWRWWTCELRDLLPEDVRNAPTLLRRDFEAEIVGDRLVLRLRFGVRYRELAEIPLDPEDPAAAGSAIREVVRRGRGGYDRVVLRVPGERALRRRTRLPLAARDSLDEALGYDMDRQTPFAEDEVYYGAREIEVDRGGGWLDAELEVIRRDDVDPALKALRHAGLDIDRIEAWPGSGANLLPSDQRPASRGIAKRASALLAIAALGLTIAAGYLPLHHLQSQLAAVERRVEAARNAANQVETLRLQLAELHEREDRVFERKRNEPAALALLNEVTQAMPDGTFAIDFALDGEEIRVTGYSDKASDLISKLEGAPLLSESRFRSPVTQDQRLEAERYDVAARITTADEEGKE